PMKAATTFSTSWPAARTSYVAVLMFRVWTQKCDKAPGMPVHGAGPARPYRRAARVPVRPSPAGGGPGAVADCGQREGRDGPSRPHVCSSGPGPGLPVFHGHRRAVGSVGSGGSMDCAPMAVLALDSHGPRPLATRLPA